MIIDVLIGFSICMLLVSTFFIYLCLGSFVLRVPFVCSRDEAIDVMIQKANIKKLDRVYDTGSGDGKILFLAAKNGARCVGIERLWPLVLWSRLKSWWYEVPIEFRIANFFKTDLSDADVIFCYTTYSLMDKFYLEKFHELKKGAKIISNSFNISHIEPSEKVWTGKSWVYIYEK